MIDLNFEICDGVSFRDLCRDIIDRSNDKKSRVDALCATMTKYIIDAASALNFGMQIKGLIDSGVKNDEQLIKLAAILQRIQAAQAESGTDGGLTDAEKDQLFHELHYELRQFLLQLKPLCYKNICKWFFSKYTFRQQYHPWLRS